MRTELDLNTNCTRYSYIFLPCGNRLGSGLWHRVVWYVVTNLFRGLPYCTVLWPRRPQPEFSLSWTPQMSSSSSRARRFITTETKTLHWTLFRNKWFSSRREIVVILREGRQIQPTSFFQNKKLRKKCSNYTGVFMWDRYRGLNFRKAYVTIIYN